MSKPFRFATYNITEHKKTETTYQTLVENALQGLVIIQDNQIVFANPTIARISGYDVEELLAFSWEEATNIIHPEDRAWVLENLAQLMESQVPQHMEFRFAHRDGVIRWVETFASTVMYQGQPAIQISQVDITDRKEAELELRQSQEVLTRAEKIAVLGSYRWDMQSNEVIWSENLRLILGVEDAKPTYDLYVSRIHPEDRERVLNTSQIRADIDYPQAAEYRILHPDGTVRHVRDVFEVEFDADGNPMWMLGTNLDITELKQAEMRSRFQSQLLDSVREAVIAIDLDEQITYWGKGAEALYGYTAEEAKNQLISLVIETSESDTKQKRVEQILEHGSWQGKSIKKHKDGTEFWVDSHISLVKDEHDLSIGYIGIDRDATEHHEIQEALTFIAQHTWLMDSDKAFATLVSYLGDKLGVAQVMVGKLNEDLNTVTSIAYYVEGEIVDNIVYDLEGSPCRNVVNNELCYYPNGVQALFPQDTMLQTMEIESFMGMPLWDSTGNRLGIIVMLDTQPFQKAQLAETLVQVVADGISHELERREVGAKLRSSELRWRSLIENLPNVFFEFDLDGVIQFINFTVDGRSTEAVVGKSIYDFTPPAEHDRVRGYVEQVAQTGEPISYEIFGVDDRWYSVRIGAVQQDDRVNRLMMILTDITELKQSEIALRESEGQLRQAMRIARLGIWDWEIKTDVTRWFGEIFNMYGITPEEFTGVGSDYFEFTREDYRAEQVANVQQAFENGVTEEQLRADVELIYDPKELCLVRPDGTEAYTYGDAITIVDDEGNPIRMLGVILDITDQKRAEQLLQARLRLSEFALDHSLRNLLQKTLDEAEALTGSQIGFFYFVIPDQTTLTLQVWSTQADGQFDDAGGWIECIRERRPIIHNDHDTQILKRELVVPVFQDDRIVAVLGVGNKPGEYDETDVEMASQLANMAWDIVMRKQAEEALRRSEKRFRSTFEQAAVGIAHVAPDGKFLRINQRFCDMVGYSREEMLELTFQAITHPDDLEADLEQVRRVLDGEIATYAMEKRYIRKDSNVVWINLTVALIRDDDGQPDYFISVVEDITTRKQAEKQINQLRDRFSKIFHSSPAVITLSHLESGVFLEVNRAFEELFGYSHAEAVGKSSFELNISLSEDRRQRIVNELRSQPSLQNREITVRGKSGKLLTMLGSFEIVTLQEEEMLLSAFADITERKEAEQALQESERNFHHLLGSITDYVWNADVVDGEIIYRYYSPVVEQITGYTPEFFLSGADAWMSIVHPADQHRVSENVQRELSGRAD